MLLPAERRERLQIAIVINQLATPGLGSWIAGHRCAGAGQLLVSLSGFGWFLVDCVRLVGNSIRAALQGNEAPPFPSTAWESALILFGIAWLWAAITSLQVLRQIQRIPPRLERAPLNDRIRP